MDHSVFRAQELSYHLPHPNSARGVILKKTKIGASGDLLFGCFLSWQVSLFFFSSLQLFVASDSSRVGVPVFYFNIFSAELHACLWAGLSSKHKRRERNKSILTPLKVTRI